LDLSPKPVNNPEKLLGEDQCRCESTGTVTANRFRLLVSCHSQHGKEYQRPRIQSTLFGAFASII
jgi:hypothetical protein